MTVADETAQSPNSGAFALAVFLRLLGVADTNPRQAGNLSTARGLGLNEIVRRAREFGVKARARTIDWVQLARAPLPAIAVLRNGEFLALGRIADEGVVVVRPRARAPKPEFLTREAFEAEWSGRVVLGQSRVLKWTPTSLGALTGLWRHVVGALKSLFGASPESEAAAPETTEGAASAATAGGATDESGFECLTLLLGFHGIGADAAQIRHRLGVARAASSTCCAARKELGLKASVCATRWDRLASTPLPAIAALRDGGFLILGKVGDDKALVQRAGAAAAGN